MNKKQRRIAINCQNATRKREGQVLSLYRELARHEKEMAQFNMICLLIIVFSEKAVTQAIQESAKKLK